MAAFEVGKTYKAVNTCNMAEERWKVVAIDSLKSLTLPRIAWFKFGVTDDVLGLHVFKRLADTGEQVEQCCYRKTVKRGEFETYTKVFTVSAKDVVDDD